MVLLLYCDKMYPVPEARSTYLVKTGLKCSIGICWLTVGLLLGAPGSKFVHVLILLKINPGCLGGWANRANVFLVFPVGVFL